MRKNRAQESGLSLLEVLVANVLLLVAVAGLVVVFDQSVVTNKVQGDRGTRATIYAQAKMEELMLLRFNDTTTDTRTVPFVVTAGTGLSDGGSLNLAAPTPLFSDFLDEDGNRVAQAQAYYARLWQIRTNPAPNNNSKTITVAVFTRRTFGPNTTPSTFLVNIKANL